MGNRPRPCVVAITRSRRIGRVRAVSLSPHAAWRRNAIALTVVGQSPALWTEDIMRHPIEQRVADRAARHAVSNVVRRVVAVPPRTFVREIALMAAIFVGYRQIRVVTHDETDVALGNAQWVLDIQHGWFVSERSVQALALRSETVIGLLNRYYVGVHFPITIAFVLWLLVRHPTWYRTIRNWMIAVTASALAIHVAFPLAPPRMLAGFVDTLDVYGPDIYPTDHTQSVANQFAAMPSLHFGWSVMVAIGFILVARGRRRWAALAHPLVTLLAIVATANHYWLDAAVAGLLVAGFAVPTVVRTRRNLSAVAAPRSIEVIEAIEAIDVDVR
jgi:hypothetical protein